MCVLKDVGDSRTANNVSERKLIIPGVAETGKIGQITKWPVEIGQVSGFELPIIPTSRK